MVVLPAPDIPANKNARSLRTALAACTRKPPSSAKTRECAMRKTVSIEYGFGDWRTQPCRVPASHSARKMPNAAVSENACFLFGRLRRWRREVNRKFVVGLGQRIQKACIALFYHVAKTRILGHQTNGNSADLDVDA